jgi:hypothetical protein
MSVPSGFIVEMSNVPDGPGATNAILPFVPGDVAAAGSVPMPTVIPAASMNVTSADRVHRFTRAVVIGPPGHRV